MERTSPTARASVVGVSNIANVNLVGALRSRGAPRPRDSCATGSLSISAGASSVNSSSCSAYASVVVVVGSGAVRLGSPRLRLHGGELSGRRSFLGKKFTLSAGGRARGKSVNLCNLLNWGRLIIICDNTQSLYQYTIVVLIRDRCNSRTIGPMLAGPADRRLIIICDNTQSLY